MLSGILERWRKYHPFGRGRIMVYVAIAWGISGALMAVAQVMFGAQIDRNAPRRLRGMPGRRPSPEAGCHCPLRHDHLADLTHPRQHPE
jgi:hypothetical protein